MNIISKFGQQKDGQIDLAARSKVHSWLSSSFGRRRFRAPLREESPHPQEPAETGSKRYISEPKPQPEPEPPELTSVTAEPTVDFPNTAALGDVPPAAKRTQKKKHEIPTPAAPEGPETITNIPVVGGEHGDVKTESITSTTSTTPLPVASSRATTAIARRTLPTEEIHLSAKKKLIKEQEEQVLNAWLKGIKPKKLPIPTDYPDYMKDKPKLQYTETDTSLLRREFNKRKIMRYNYPPTIKKKKSPTGGPPPKENKTSTLRQSFINKKPIMSDYFERHYSTYNRPPFRNMRLKLNS